jgi:hypothetical protein
MSWRNWRENPWTGCNDDKNRKRARDGRVSSLCLPRPSMGCVASRLELGVGSDDVISTVDEGVPHSAIGWCLRSPLDCPHAFPDLHGLQHGGMGRPRMKAARRRRGKLAPITATGGNADQTGQTTAKTAAPIIPSTGLPMLDRVLALTQLTTRHSIPANEAIDKPSPSCEAPIIELCLDLVLLGQASLCLV